MYHRANGVLVLYLDSWTSEERENELRILYLGEGKDSEPLLFIRFFYRAKKRILQDLKSS